MIDGLDEGEFTEGHELPSKVESAAGDDWATAIAGGGKAVVGEVRLGQRQAQSFRQQSELNL
jgi:hypothetical protein